MFTIAQSPTYSAQVTVTQPGDNGEAVLSAFTALFKRFSQSQLDSLREQSTAGSITDAEFATQVMAGWGTDVTDANGTPLDFNDANFAAVLDVFPVRQCIVRAFYASLNAAKAKN
jgi:hypothetical protein